MEGIQVETALFCHSAGWGDPVDFTKALLHVVPDMRHPDWIGQ